MLRRRVQEMKEVSVAIGAKEEYARALLVFNKGLDKDIKAYVELQCAELSATVRTLIAENNFHDAFEIMTAEAEVLAYIPPGQKMKLSPEVTLVEDIL